MIPRSVQNIQILVNKTATDLNLVVRDINICSFGRCAIVVSKVLADVVFFHHGDPRVYHKRVEGVLLVLLFNALSHRNFLHYVHIEVLEGFFDLLYVSYDVCCAPHRLILDSRF